MTTKAEAESSIPRALTFKLRLDKPDDDDTFKVVRGRNGKAKKVRVLGVKLHAPIRRVSWKKFQKGDVVQFLPDPSDSRLRGARPLVEFLAKDKETPNSPFAVNVIKTPAFFPVMKLPALFCIRCFIVTTDGVKHGYKNDGRWVCQKPPCPSPAQLNAG